MIIEFVGPPGAGKTTVGQALSLLTSWPSITLDGYHGPASGRKLTAQRIGLHRTWSLLSQPSLAIEVFRCARTEGAGQGLSWMVNLLRRNRMMRSLREDSCILEEGTLSALCLALTSRAPGWDPARTLDRIMYGDVVVAMHADVGTAAHRVLERQGILSELPPRTIRRIVENYNMHMRWLTDQVSVPVIHLSADSEPHWNAQMIASVLNE